MKVWLCIAIPFMVVSGSALAQSDFLLLLNPYPNEDKIILRTESTIFQTVEDKTNGADLRQFEQQLSLRYGAILNEHRELYLSLDANLIDLDTTAVLDRTLAPISDTYYDVGVGALYRQTVKEDWRVGGQLRVGSASDRPFHSAEELYVRGIGFLQIPHLEYTSWIVVLSVNTDLQIPVFPGFGYQFPVSRRAMAVVGIPFVGAAGQLTDKIGFQLVYWPLRNADASINFQLTERIRPYAGYKWRGVRFSRAGRTDEDDRILFQDMRFFSGVRFDLTKSMSLDVKGGYLFDRRVGEGDDDSEQINNNLRFEDAWFGGIQVGFRF